MSDEQSLLDAIAEEFDAEWQTGQRPLIAEYLNRVESDQQVHLAGRLIPIDVAARLVLGEKVVPRDYRQLGPSMDAIVDRYFQSFQPQLANKNLTNADVDPNPVKPSSTDDELATRTAMAGQTKGSRTIGNYKLLQVLGEGGMGTVWMAEQQEPVRRRVALKLIKTGIDNKQVIARFEAERQALAMMDHQNIAKVLDAGTTPDGRPFFVMELVQGIPFTKYCDQNKLSIDERLELFIPVCKAVQHAHQKGIIHRDIKPSNVLVCLYDGQPVAKVIDFGLAKALQHQSKLTDKTMFTEFGQVVGTLQYMSPEQAELNQLDIDTRTDIYSLGVMLYELLTGSTPIEADTLKNCAILQVLATIREKATPRPSARLSSSTNEAIIGISHQRQIDPAKLRNILLGELDWIVMKALEKDRTRRYDTANGFADDISNYLTGDVVLARPPSNSYRFSKFLQKHRRVVATIAIFMFTLIGFVTLLSYMFVQRGVAISNATAAALRQKSAEEQLKIARQERELAETARDAEIEAKQAAQQAFDDASIQRSLAEASLQDAEKAREVALMMRREAEQQRMVAESQEVEFKAIAEQQKETTAALASSLLHYLLRSRTIESSPTHADTLEILRKSWDRSNSILEVRLLSLGEFRAEQFENSIKYGLQAINLAASTIENSAPHPIDLGIVAMSHFKLGEIDDANNFHAQFNEAMESDAFKENEECQSFVKEVDEFFAEKPKAGTDK